MNNFVSETALVETDPVTEESVLTGADGANEGAVIEGEDIREERDTDGANPLGRNPSALVIACHEYISSPDKTKRLIDKVFVSLFNDARTGRICRVRAMRNGLDFAEADEVLQRVAEVLFVKMLVELDYAKNIYFLINGIAENVTKEIVREKLVRPGGFDSIEEMREYGNEVHTAGFSGEYNDTPSDQAALHEVHAESRIRDDRLSRADEGVVANGFLGAFKMPTKFEDSPLAVMVEPITRPGVKPAARPAPAEKAKRGESTTRLTPDQAELDRICKTLRWRRHYFAEMLGIGSPCLSSYIYGRTLTVPTEVMEKARALEKEYGVGKQEQREKFDRPMSEILDEWEARIVEHGGEAVDVAAALSVVQMTVFRWRNNIVKPDDSALVRYEAALKRYIAMLDSASAKAAERTKGVV